jgi:hypothetical protein
MPTNRKTDFSKVFAVLAKVCKSVPDSHMEDLADALDVSDVASDQWNARDKGNRARTPTGPEQAMAGGRAADKFVSDYSKDTDQADGLMQGYAALASELANQGKRVEAVEKGVTAIARLIAQSMGKSFPEDETEKRGEESEDTDEERDDEESAKALPTLSVPGLMRELSGYSRSGVKGLAPPPNFAAVAKAGASTYERIADSIERLTETRDSVYAGMLLSRLRMSETNAEAAQRFTEGLAAASPVVKAAFNAAGVSVIAKASAPTITFG